MIIKIYIIWVLVSFTVAFTDTLWKTTQGPRWYPKALGDNFYSMLCFWPFICFGRLCDWFLMVFIGQFFIFVDKLHLLTGKKFYHLGQLLRRMK